MDEEVLATMDRVAAKMTVIQEQIITFATLSLQAASCVEDLIAVWECEH